ncbi:hypothetical protein KAW50_00800 [candidate division WOR-3 bacterium]|nr:hypothetical protein [candidate division WOR-3 bacterium]
MFRGKHIKLQRILQTKLKRQNHKLKFKKVSEIVGTILIGTTLIDMLSLAQGQEVVCGEKSYENRKELGITVTNNATFNLLNNIVGQTGEKERDISANFTVVGMITGILHSGLVPTRFAMEDGGLYQEKWGVVLPVCIADVAAGLLGGHTTGLVCNGWLNEWEGGTRTFFKGFTAGILGGIIWGGITSGTWMFSTDDYVHSEDYRKYNTKFFSSVGTGIVLNSIGQGVIAIFSR